VAYGGHTLKLLYVPETWFVLNLKIQLLVKGFSFFLVEIQVFNARKQMSFTRRILHFILTLAAFNSWLQRKSTFGGQVIVPDLLEFAGSDA
jgi:hypothetical protein